MTTPSTARKAGPLLGNGSTTSFPFTFKVFAASDIKVVTANSAGVETVRVLNTDYSVSLNANQETSPGGTVTYPISGAALPTGSVLSIIGNLSYDQPLDLPSGGNFSPLALENQLDRATMQIQQLKEMADRSARLPATYEAVDVEIVTADIVRLADSADNIDTTVANISDINTVANELNDPNSKLSAVAAAAPNINVVGNNIADVNTVADNIADVNTVGTNIGAVVAASGDVAAVAGALPEINTVASDLAGTGYDYDLGSITLPSTGPATSPTSAIIAVAEAIADVETVAGNIADVTNFSDVYLGPRTSDPTTRSDGNPLQFGDLYFNTVTSAMRVYTNAGWANGTIPETITIVPETFSGDGVTTAFTLSGAPKFEAACDVYLSGVAQSVNTDYNIVGNTLTFVVAPPVGVSNIYVKVLSSYVGAVPPDGSVTSEKLASLLDLGALQ